MPTLSFKFLDSATNAIEPITMPIIYPVVRPLAITSHDHTMTHTDSVDKSNSKK